MRSFTGTVTLVRFYLKRDRYRLAIWILGIAIAVAGMAWSYPESFPTQPEIESRVSMIRDNPAGTAMTGPGHALDTVTPDNYGPMIVNDIGSFTAIAVALMSIFIVIRHTRKEEETGRSELVRSAIVGPHASTAAAVIVAALANLLLAIFIALGMVVQGHPGIGSLAFGLALAMIGLVFASIAAAAAQITQNAGGATAIGGITLAIAFALRALGDVQESALSWLSPIGWSQAIRPYAEEQWWPVLIPIATSLVAVWTAFMLGTRRDVGAGMIAAKPGPANAGPRMGTSFGLNLRLQRGSLIGWTIGVLIGGLYIGLMASEAESVFADMEIYHEYITIEGATLTDGLLTTFIMWITIVSLGYAIGAANRLRSEENAGHAENVLATSVSRLRYATSILLNSIVGSLVVVSAGGIGLGLVRMSDTGNTSELFRMLGAAVAHLPAIWLLVGITIALIGFVPRALALVWAFVAYIVMVEMFGPLLGLPDWTYEGSPFRHTPQLPAGDVSLLAIGIITVIALGLMIVGILGFRRRDLYA